MRRNGIILCRYGPRRNEEGMKRNIEHRTSNIQHPIPTATANWMLGIGCWVLGVFLFVLAGTNVSAADTNSVLDHWFAAQANVHAWSADFVQTRTFKTLTRPLTA